MKNRYPACLLLSTAIAIGTSSAQTPPVEYVGVTAESDIKQVAILAIAQTYAGKEHFKCHIRSAFEPRQKLHLSIDGQSKVAFVAPGTYEFLANFEDNGHEGIDLPQVKLEGGKRYQVACVRKRYRVVGIEVQEVLPPPPK